MRGSGSRGSGSFSTRVANINPGREWAGIKGGSRCRWGSEVGPRTSTMRIAALASRPRRYWSSSTSPSGGGTTGPEGERTVYPAADNRAWGRPSLARGGGMLRNFSRVEEGGRAGGAGEEGTRTVLSPNWTA